MFEIKHDRIHVHMFCAFKNLHVGFKYIGNSEWTQLKNILHCIYSIIWTLSFTSLNYGALWFQIEKLIWDRKQCFKRNNLPFSLQKCSLQWRNYDFFVFHPSRMINLVLHSLFIGICFLQLYLPTDIPSLSMLNAIFYNIFILILIFQKVLEFSLHEHWQPLGSRRITLSLISTTKNNYKRY